MTDTPALEALRHVDRRHKSDRLTDDREVICECGYVATGHTWEAATDAFATHRADEFTDWLTANGYVIAPVAEAEVGRALSRLEPGAYTIHRHGDGYTVEYDGWDVEGDTLAEAVENLMAALDDEATA